MSQNFAHNDAMRVAISGGGTGGHLFPALAIAKQLQQEAPNTEVLFVGAKGRMEMDKVPKAGYHIQGLWIAGMIRGANAKNLLLPLKILVSFVQAWRLLNRFKPHVAIGTGGFASGPLLFMATKMGIPTLIQEQNFFPGLTNRLLASYVDRVCGVYEELTQYFDHQKLVITGNPVREALSIPSTSKETALKAFGLESGKLTFLVVGGSLGATTLNQAMEATIPNLPQHEIQGIWQCGKAYYDSQAHEAGQSAYKSVTMQPFIEDMPLAYKASDLVIARAGAITLAELAYLAKPAILVPSPNVAADHQTKNAAVLANHHAAIMIKDEQAIEQIPDVLPALLNDPEQLRQLSDNISTFAKPDATKHITQEIFKLTQAATSGQMQQSGKHNQSHKEPQT